MGWDLGPPGGKTCTTTCTSTSVDVVDCESYRAAAEYITGSYTATCKPVISLSYRWCRGGLGDQFTGSSGFALLNTAWFLRGGGGCTVWVLACLRHSVGSAGALCWLSAAQMMPRNPGVHSLGHVPSNGRIRYSADNLANARTRIV